MGGRCSSSRSAGHASQLLCTIRVIAFILCGIQIVELWEGWDIHRSKLVQDRATESWARLASYHQGFSQSDSTHLVGVELGIALRTCSFQVGLLDRRRKSDV